MAKKKEEAKEAKEATKKSEKIKAKAKKKEVEEVEEEAEEVIEEAESKEPVSRTERKRAEKAARREAKAARKKANIVEEKKSKISNGVLAAMIFGVLIAMFAFVWGYNYFSKEASIESYIENAGGEAVFGNYPIDDHRTASISAKKNDMTIVITVNTDSDEELKEQKKYYKSEDAQDELEYLGAYFLKSIKPSVRGFSASAKCVVKIDKKKVTTVNVKYKDAEDILENYGATSESTETEE